MTIQKLDFIFPFVVFGYGLIMTLVLNSPALMALAKERLPQSLYTQYVGHRHLGVICLVVGALWSLQNIWTA